MSLAPDDARRIPIAISTDAEVEARIDDLIGRACRRQVWLLFLDSHDIQLPAIIPMADYPADPYEGRAEIFASRISDTMEAIAATQVIVVWERRLSSATKEADRVWGRELAAACDAIGVRIRAQLISHKEGVRWLSPDDFL